MKGAGCSTRLTRGAALHDMGSCTGTTEAWQAHKAIPGRVSQMLRAKDLAPLVLLAVACSEQAPAPADIAAPDTAAPDTAAPDTAAPDLNAAARADAGPAGPVSPLKATGLFVDVSAKLGLSVATDPGEAGKRVPKANIGLALDYDDDGKVDLIVADGLGKVHIGVGKSPWLWHWQQVMQAPQDFTGALAVIDLAPNKRRLVVGGSQLHLLRDTGPGPWVDEAEKAGLVLPPNGAVQGIVPGDFDADGVLDLAVALFTCDKNSRLHIFLGRGDGTFEERAEALGLVYGGTLWATMFTDLDGDGQTDLLALAESCPPDGGNAWLRAQGFPTQGKRFASTPLPPLFDAPNPGGGTPMGGAVGDLDGDGRLDYVFSEIGLRKQQMGGVDLTRAKGADLAAYADSANHLLHAQAEGGFASRGPEAGIAAALSSTKQPMVSWSPLLMDVDHDGHLDLFMSHGHDWGSFLISDTGGMRPVLFRNRGDATFDDMSAVFGLPDLHLARSIAAADLDNDGDLDLLFGGQSMAPLLLRNDVVHDGQWLAIRLRGRASNPWGLGALLELQTATRTWVAEMSTQAPTHGMAAPLVHFALPAGAQVGDLRVRWPSGYSQVVSGLTTGELHTIEEPPLVTLSQRVSALGASVMVQAQAFNAKGEGLPASVGVAIELAPGSTGKWLGGTACTADGVCERQWLGTVDGGVDSLIISFGGKPLQVRPRIRY